MQFPPLPSLPETGFMEALPGEEAKKQFASFIKLLGDQGAMITIIFLRESVVTSIAFLGSIFRRTDN